jgi:type IV pilus assembly protein PilY1
MSLFRNRLSLPVALLVLGAGSSSPVAAQSLPISQRPLFIQEPAPPLNMLVMARDHKLYFEAYNDASDLNGDGVLDTGFKPDSVTYFGYFDSNKCYNYSSGVFRPAGVTANKRCSGSWSGDFLNYLTTPRIDALRKVLYGGKRSTDNSTETILERAFIPEDGHSWGKQYLGTAVDGYNIAEYAPLSQPAVDRRHLFASTQLAANGVPVLRVMTDSPFEIWNWLSIERPVARDDCFNASNQRVNCLAPAGTFPGHPASSADFDTLEANYVGFPFGSAAITVGAAGRINCTANCNQHGTDNNYLSVITGEIEFNANTGGNYQFAIDGDEAVDFTIFDTSGNPAGSAGFYGSHGTCGCNTNATAVIAVPNSGAVQRYRFRFRHEDATGGDAFILRWQKTSGSNTFGFQVVPTDASGSNVNGGTRAVNLATYNLTPAVPNGSVRTDYTVRVEVCNAAFPESNCRLYVDPANAAQTNLKPTGLLHDYGERREMQFGLITGTYANNTEGGVLRRRISEFAGLDANADGDFVDAGDVAPEVDAATGNFTSEQGIVYTLDKLQIQGFTYGNYQHSFTGSNCPALGSRALANGECRIWGNPLAEMMYESLRYFGGAGAPTPAYSSGGSTLGQAEEGAATPVLYGGVDVGYTGLNLPAPTWDDPYDTASVCAKPFQTLISDINPSYDGGLPGNAFGETAPNGTTPAPLTALNVASEGDAIWTNEFGGGRQVFIGQSGGTADAAPTVKSASSFGNVRGLAPEEPTKGGTFYSASVAHYGLVRDINPIAEAQNLLTYSVALASPLPRIEFPIGGRTITLVPFAKSAAHPGVTGNFAIDPAGAFQPTNTIVDFYVQKIVNLPGQPTDVTVNGGRGFAQFRINYEDVEQGNDHDMDAIVLYEVSETATGTLKVELSSEYAAGSVVQHMGYVISGTSADGIYLEVRDRDSSGTAQQVRYRFDTPPGQSADACNTATPAIACPLADYVDATSPVQTFDDGIGIPAGLPLHTVREFTPGGSAGATLLRDPLWYAAKYGGFDDIDRNGMPNGNSEFDTDANGIPDNYFLVTNALGLKDQLARAFQSIILRNSPSGSVSATGTQINEGSLAFIPEFSNTKADWYGDVTAYRLTSDGQVLSSNALWKASARLPAHAARRIFTVTDSTEASAVTADFTAAGMGGDTATLGLLNLTVSDLVANYGFAAASDVSRVVDYIRGDTTGERRNGGPFRDRTNVLGDILGSQPVTYIQNFGYTALPTGEGGGLTGYGTYVQGKASRTPMLFVGDNAGMLHAYEATPGTSGGREVFAFVPNEALANLQLLADPAYQHHYFVDSTPAVGDAFLGSQWRTYLVGSMAAGGRSVFAMDVTDPATSFDRSNIKWELTPRSSADFQDLGFSFGQPVISLTKMGWVAIFGNGLNSDRGLAALYVVDLATGRLLQKITLTGDTTDPNGLSSVAPVDTDGDLKTDRLYAGDYHGNIWAFDVDTSGVTVDYGGSPFFSAVDAGGVRQPITGGIDVARHHLGGQLVVAGTGRYLLTDDNDVPVSPAVPQTQTIYGLWDNSGNASYTSPTRGELQAQTVTAADATFRKVSQNTVDWTTQKGWFLDLLEADGTALGERFISRPVVRFGKVFANTFTPTGNSCRPGGKNFQFILAALTGGSDLLLPPGYSFCDSGDCGGITLGIGPPAGIPVLAITQPTSTQCDPSLDPSCNAAPYTPCDEADPTCTTPEPTPGAILNDRCGFIVNVVPPGSPQVRLARPCGRQSWRQVE